MKRRNEQLSTHEIGRIQPNARDIEGAVLGALMIEKSAISLVEDILSPDDFYETINGIIYKAIVSLKGQKKPVDMLTVSEELKRMGELDNIGGPFYISQLTSKVASSAHIEYHARIIKDKSKSRKVISLCSTTASRAYDDLEDISDVMEDHEKGFTEITTDLSGLQSISMWEALSAARDKAGETETLRKEGKRIAIPTGLNQLDSNLSGGWRAPDLIIVGGRPSMGKTQHALSFAKAAAMHGKHVLFASIEMTPVQLAERYILENDRISSYNLRTGQMTHDEWDALDRTTGTLRNLPIHIAGSHEIRYLSNIKSEARRLKRKGELDLLIIDYLGLIKTNMRFERRQLEIAHITGELKNLAKELNIPIILLSQLNRPQKGVAVKPPQLEDLRESGDIEQDADIVLFIHKPDYYDPDAVDTSGRSWKDRGFLIIGKYREGARNENVIFHHDRQYKKISDLPFENKPMPF